MTVASRALDSDKWQFTLLPEHVVWDSHNYVTMAFDSGGFLHVSGNMHVVPLVYFRAEQQMDATSLQRRSAMAGKNESRTTYPHFLQGVSGELIFTYRDGRSGSGDQIYNVYDVAEKTWRRLIDRPLTDGQSKMNAYFSGPVRGKDGYFHLCWVWRNSGGCETNHDLTYAKSKDLVHWERSNGAPLVLPISLQSGEIVDPVPVLGGMINGNTKIGFDSKNRVIISYHKYDEKGFTQIYCARLEDGKWKVYQVSDWNYRWDFHGGGSIPFEITVGSVATEADGSLGLSYHHAKLGGGTWKLDETTLKPVGTLTHAPRYPREIGKVESAFPGMQVHWGEDSGSSGEKGVSYVLRWETLGANRDQPRTGALPEAGMLKLYKLAR